MDDSVQHEERARGVSIVIGEWSLAILMTFVLIGCWFILQPSLTFIVITLDNSITGMGIGNANIDNIVSILRLAINITIPIMIIAFWGWAVISSQRKAWQGYPA